MLVVRVQIVKFTHVLIKVRRKINNSWHFTTFEFFSLFYIFNMVTDFISFSSLTDSSIFFEQKFDQTALHSHLHVLCTSDSSSPAQNLSVPRGRRTSQWKVRELHGQRTLLKTRKPQNQNSWSLIRDADWHWEMFSKRNQETSMWRSVDRADDLESLPQSDEIGLEFARHLACWEYEKIWWISKWKIFRDPSFKIRCISYSSIYPIVTKVPNAVPERWWKTITISLIL